MLINVKMGIILIFVKEMVIKIDPIEDAKNIGKKVGVFPIDDEAWIDVGQWAEYKKAVDIL